MFKYERKGVFEISEANRTIRCLEIKAYDYMLRFEKNFNGFETVENWRTGKHILSLYYPIDSLVLNFTNTFNLYLRMNGGSGVIEIGVCIASISGQGMEAVPAWDGKSKLEETLPLFLVGGGFSTNNLSDAVSLRLIEKVERKIRDSIGTMIMGAFAKPVDTS